MKRDQIWKFGTVGFGLLSAVLLVRGVPVAHAEPQPHMKGALVDLEKAAKQLREASRDKGTHRVKALALTEEAIDQVKKGIEFDNRH